MENTRVLVVDDEQVVRDFMAETLARAGYVVYDVPDGQEAMDALRSGSYDVVVTDLRMPNLTGLETCHKLRKFHAGVGIVAVTGARNAYAYSVALKRLGVEIMLTKPFAESDLLEAVERALGTPV